MILGSGWNAVAESLVIEESIEYERIPCLGATGVEGHAGRLLLARASGLQVLVFQGRRHWYEGVGWEPIALPVFVAREMGVTCLVVTNASGAIRRDLEPGQLLLITDHINAMGANPLTGPHDSSWGERFPDQTRVYNPELSELLREAADHVGSPLATGVYVATMGPTYETPAEIRAFEAMGADIVGMSTVPEAILGNAAGMRVAGLSCVANMASGIAEEPLSHADVLSAVNASQRKMATLFTEFFALLAARPFLPGDDGQ
jgi:purine-nucleoside phosphorylase